MFGVSPASNQFPIPHHFAPCLRKKAIPQAIQRGGRPPHAFSNLPSVEIAHALHKYAKCAFPVIGTLSCVIAIVRVNRRVDDLEQKFKKERQRNRELEEDRLFFAGAEFKRLASRLKGSEVRAHIIDSIKELD